MTETMRNRQTGMNTSRKELAAAPTAIATQHERTHLTKASRQTIARLPRFTLPSYHRCLRAVLSAHEHLAGHAGTPRDAGCGSGPDGVEKHAGG